jgi:hypothetical protein
MDYCSYDFGVVEYERENDYINLDDYSRKLGENLP